MPLRPLLRQARTAAIAAALLASYPTDANATTGLGSLIVVQILLAIFVLILVIGAIALGFAIRSARKAGPDGPRGWTALVPRAFLFLGAPLALPLLFGASWMFLLLFLALYVATAVYTVGATDWGRRHRHGLVTAGCLALAMAFVLSPRVTSFTKFEFVENDPLGPGAEAPLPQVDPRHLFFPDGRHFFVEDRYIHHHEMLPPGERVEVQRDEVGDARNTYTLDVRSPSSEQHAVRGSRVEPLITIPLRTVSIPLYQRQTVARLALLDDSWVPDAGALARAMGQDACCNASWIAELLRRGAKPRPRTQSRSVLHRVSAYPPYGADHERIVDLLLGAGVAIEAHDRQGQSPLAVAVSNVMYKADKADRLRDSHWSFLRLLLARGADPNAKDQRGRTMVDRAIVERFYGIAELLLEAGADPKWRDPKGRTYLERAVECRDTQCLNLTETERRELERLIQRLRGRHFAGRPEC